VLGALIDSHSLSPAPILEAVERYRGRIIDLDSSRSLSADAFARARQSLRASLRTNDLSPGDRVLLAVANGPAFIAALAAVLECEASPLLVHFRTPPAELQRYAERFGARFVLGEAELEPGLASIARSTIPVPLGDFSQLCWASLHSPDPSTVDHESLRGVPLHPTSGSTGSPKMALRPGFAAVEEARHYVETLAIDADDLIAAIPPMSHAYGFGMCAMVPLVSGASIVSTSRFSARWIHRALAEFPVTVLPLAPAMLDMLSFGAGVDLRSVRWTLTAGATLPRGAAERFRAKTGTVPCPLYGTTETGGISVATRADGQDVDGRVGPPMAGVSIEVRQQGTMPGLGPDVGKLFVRSSSMMHGYLQDDRRVTVPRDGWFETGDLARITSDGTIQLRGRDSEVVNVSGMKVAPCEVEEAIASLVGVREVKVYAGAVGTSDQIVKAAIVAERDLTAADVRRHCEQHLVYYKRPHVVTLLEALPRSATGKIIRAQLP